MTVYLYFGRRYSHDVGSDRRESFSQIKTYNSALYTYNAFKTTSCITFISGLPFPVTESIGFYRVADGDETRRRDGEESETYERRKERKRKKEEWKLNANTHTRR